MLFNEITVEEFAEIRAREAYEDGEKAGLARGAAQKEREIAKSMKDKGLEAAMIVELTGLTPGEIKAL